MVTLKFCSQSLDVIEAEIHDIQSSSQAEPNEASHVFIDTNAINVMFIAPLDMHIL